MHLWVGSRDLIENVLPPQMTLIFQGNNPVQSHFGPYLDSCWTNCCQILTKVSLSGAFQQIKKHLEWFEHEVRYIGHHFAKNMSLIITF